MLGAIFSLLKPWLLPLPEADVLLADGGSSLVPQGAEQAWGQGARSKPRDACWWSWWVGGGPGASFQRGEWDLLCQVGRRGVDAFSLPVTHE